MSTVVWMHASWMVATTAVGTLSGYLGLLRALQRPDGKSLLPGRFNLRVHQWSGIAFYAMLYAGILGGFLMVDIFFGDRAPHGFWLWHRWIAVSIAVLYAPAAWLGLAMMKKPAGAGRGRPIAHMILNFAACTLVGIQIVLAILRVRGVI